MTKSLETQIYIWNECKSKSCSHFGFRLQSKANLALAQFLASFYQMNAAWYGYSAKLGLKRCSKAGFGDSQVKAVIAVLVLAKAAAETDSCNGVEIYNKPGGKDNNYMIANVTDLLIYLVIANVTLIFFCIGCFCGKWFLAGGVAKPAVTREAATAVTREAATQTETEERKKEPPRPHRAIPEELYIAPISGERFHTFAGCGHLRSASRVKRFTPCLTCSGAGAEPPR